MGMRTVTGDMIVGTGAGVWRTRTVQTRPQSEMWAIDVAEMVGGVPWHTSEEDEDAHGPSGKTQLQGGMPEVEVERTAAAEGVPALVHRGPR